MRTAIIHFFAILATLLIGAGEAGAAAPQVAAGCFHIVALKSDGTVWAWGANYWGQLGDGSGLLQSRPVQVSGLTGVTAIAAGCNHTVALKSDGTVWAWGDNGTGQVGDASLETRMTPVQVSGLTGVTAIAAGEVHTLALKEDGTVWGWGDNWNGELGDGTIDDSTVPVQVDGLSGVKGIAAGGYHSLAVRSDDTAWGWGGNDTGQLGDGTFEDSLTPVQVAGLSGVTALAAGYSHSLAVKIDGTAWAWGWNRYGQLGDGSQTDRGTPVRVSGLSGVTAVAAADFRSAAVKSDGTVWGWGQNSGGQLGDGGTVQRNTPVQVKGATGIARIAARNFHSVAVDVSGAVWTWGYNGFGELGNGTTDAQTTPVPVPVLTGVKALAAGESFSLALRTDGTVWSWGANYDGQLGDGSNESRLSPVQVSGLTGVTAIAAGCSHGVAVKDGTVWSWGANEYGQLGDGSTVSRPVPVQVPPASGVSGVVSVAAGCSHTIAQTATNFLWAWGENNGGQLGDGTFDSRNTPVESFTGVTSAAGGLQSAAAFADGSVYQWGYNHLDPPSTRPAKMAGVDGVKSLAAGSAQIAALRRDGTVWSWGLNDYGQVGDGTVLARSTPVTVAGISGASAISAGSFHTLALKEDGTAWAWGCNDDGQLGDGSTESRSTPVQVPRLPMVIALKGGANHTVALASDGTVWAWGGKRDGQTGIDPGWSPVQALINLGQTQYVVTPSAGAGGYLSPSMPRPVLAGSSTSFTVVPFPGYRTASVSGCGGSLSGNSYTTGAVGGDCAVTASFEVAAFPLTVTFAGSGSGSVTGITTGTPNTVSFAGTGSSLISSGAVVTLTARAAAGSAYASWNGCDSVNGAACSVTLGSARSVTVTFVPTYSVSGSVKTATGVAIPGVTVSLAGTAAKTAVTDTLGNYSLTGLLAGSYTVAPAKTSYIFTPANRAVTVGTGNLTGQSFVGTPVYTISGSVKTSSGAAISGATVALSGAAVKRTTTDAYGNYSFTGLLKGSYTVAALRPTFVFTPASRAATVGPANATAQNFVGAPTFTLSGSVTSTAGTAISGVTVALAGSVARSAVTDAYGNYSFTGVLAGNYSLTPAKAGFVFTPAVRTATVSTANVAAQAFVGTQTYSISGSVKTAAGAAISGVAVSVKGTAVKSATTDAYGNYSFTGLLKGSYTVTVAKPTYIFTPASRAVTVTTLNVTAQNFTGMPTFTVSGSVKTALGAAISGAAVSLGGTAVKSATTDAYGNYSFTGILKGSYTVGVAKATYIFTPASRAVTVTTLNVTGQNFVGAPTYTISGSVKTASGAAISGAAISLGGTAVKGATTDAYGNYSFTGLLKGSYTLKPVKTGYTFTPASRAVTLGTVSVTGQSFTGTKTQ